MRSEYAKVLENKTVAQDFVLLTLFSPAAFEQPIQPGQFAHLKVPNAPDRLLRRPISILRADAAARTLTLGIQPKGEGTRLLCAVRPGDSIELLAPLGNGFSAGDAPTIWLIGGGVGAAPMLFCAEAFGKSAEIVSFLGFRTAAMVYARDDFSACGRTVLCTDDGSLGLHGTVLDAMCAESSLPDRIMACGPAPMLRAVQTFCRERSIPGQLSLEQRMGCGYGACLTCACPVTREDHTQTYERVCADGPVFDAERVVL